MKTYDSLIRVSKMGSRLVSADSTMTIDDQRGANNHAIGAAGGKLGREFRAIDQSGYSVTESTAWRDALKRCERGESAGIVVAYGDRLTRNWRKVGAYYDALEAAGAEVIIAGMPGIDYRTPEGRAQTGMMAVMGDMAWQAAKARGDRIADATMARGVPNRVPYGYRRNWHDGARVDAGKDDKALVPDPETECWVRLIFRMRADRYSWTQISGELERLGVPGPRSALWSKSTLASLVRNQTYLGVVTLGKRTVNGAHEALVSASLWHEAQSTQRVSPRNGRLIGGLASGLLVCSTCGGRLSVLGGRDHTGGSRVSYGCHGRSSSRRCARPVHITKPVVDDLVDAWVVQGIEGEEPFDVFSSARELEAARAAHARAVEQRKRIVETAAGWEPEDADAAYRAAKAAEIGALADYEQASARATEIAEMPGTADAWHALDLDAQRRIVRLLLDHIEITPPLSRSKFASIAARVKFVERDGGS